MDIHKSKPWRDRREFLREILVVVIGVLLALGAGQVVERFHERQIAAEARDNIRRELADTFDRFDHRAVVQPCIATRLAQVDGLLRTAGSPTYKAPTWVGRPQIWDVETARWEAASQAGRASLFGADEQGLYGKTYTSLKEAAAAEVEEQQAWAHLRSLEDDPHPSPILIASLKLALQDARFQDWNVRISLGQAHDAVAKLHLPRGATYLIGSTSICLPLDTSRAEAAKLISPRWGEP